MALAVCPRGYVEPSEGARACTRLVDDAALEAVLDRGVVVLGQAHRALVQRGLRIRRGEGESLFRRRPRRAAELCLWECWRTVASRGSMAGLWAAIPTFRRVLALVWVRRRAP